MENLHILLKDIQNNTIFSNLPPQCGACVQLCNSENEITNSCGEKGKRRRGLSLSTNGSIFICSNELNLLESGKVFKKTLHLYRSMISHFHEVKNAIAKKEAERVNRLFHNLTSLNGHSIQEIYALIPQEKLLENFRNQKKVVKEYLEIDPSAAAETILRLLKNEMSAKSEFSVYRKLYDPNPVLRVAKHEIHKVILNVVTLFFQDLADRNVKVYISASNQKLNFDYDSFQVAIYHILDNAAKYAEPDTDIMIGFVSEVDKYKISFEMTSLHISPDELDLLFEEGYSGVQAKIFGGAGSGLGMGLIRQLLELNNAKIYIKAGAPQPSSKAIIFEERKYAKNSFTIEFPKNNIA